MQRLNEFGSAWRNYLYAYQDGVYNDKKSFKTHVEIINNSLDDICEAIISDIPNMDIITECKEEIAFQKYHLQDIINEFVEYYNIVDPIHAEEQKVTAEELLNELCKEGENSFLYIIATDWEDWSKSVKKIYTSLMKIDSDKRVYDINDDISRLIFEEVYNNCWRKN